MACSAMCSALYILLDLSCSVARLLRQSAISISFLPCIY